LLYPRILDAAQGICLRFPLRDAPVVILLVNTKLGCPGWRFRSQFRLLPPALPTWRGTRKTACTCESRSSGAGAGVAWKCSGRVTKYRVLCDDVAGVYTHRRCKTGHRPGVYRVGPNATHRR